METTMTTFNLCSKFFSKLHCQLLLLIYCSEYTKFLIFHLRLKYFTTRNLLCDSNFCFLNCVVKAKKKKLHFFLFFSKFVADVRFHWRPEKFPGIHRFGRSLATTGKPEETYNAKFCTFSLAVNTAFKQSLSSQNP